MKQGKIPFLSILDTIEKLLDGHEPKRLESVEDIMAVDAEVRAAVAELHKTVL